MKRIRKLIVATGFLVILSLVLAFLPWLPWSTKSRHFVKRLIAKVEMTALAWKGDRSSLISITGRTFYWQAPLKGVEIEVLDSVSGWASVTDESGSFIVQDVKWYPGVRYTILITLNAYQLRQVSVLAPDSLPEQGVLTVGDVAVERGCRTDETRLEGRNSRSYIEYDTGNMSYYRRLFDYLTTDQQTNEAKLQAIASFVSGRLLPYGAEHDKQPRRRHPALPRDVLDNGSYYCGDLAFALATIAEAGNYRTRVLDLLKGNAERSAHMVTEVYYDGKWHLYDPVIGSPVHLTQGNRVASYIETRIDSNHVPLSILPEHLPLFVAGRVDRVAGEQRVQSHHYYYLER
jgi:hypothetical protein